MFGGGIDGHSPRGVVLILLNLVQKLLIRTLQVLDGVLAQHFILEVLEIGFKQLGGDVWP